MWHSLSRCGYCPKWLRRRNLDAPRVTLTPEEVAEYAGRFGDPSQVFTPAEKCEGLEVSAELLDQPGAWLPVLRPAAAPPAEVAFLAEDMAVVNGSRVPFVRDAEGRVQWVSAGLRLVPRVDAVA
jgi:hypothetical protein